jgi:hypothetical protein
MTVEGLSSLWHGPGLTRYCDLCFLREMDQAFSARHAAKVVYAP